MSGAREKLDWLRINRTEDLARIAKFVRQQSVNTFSCREDRNGNTIFMLGWDDKPDSDWGRFRGNSAAIWLQSSDDRDAVEMAVRAALGWQVTE